VTRLPALIGSIFSSSVREVMMTFKLGFLLMHSSTAFEAVAVKRSSDNGICNREHAAIIACRKVPSTAELDSGTIEVARAQANESAPTMFVICCPTPIPKMQLSLTKNEGSESFTRKPQLESSACTNGQRILNSKHKNAPFQQHNQK